MLWLYLALIAYFLNALSFIVDKYLLSSPIPQPFAYAFWVSILSISAVALIPFGIAVPSLNYFLIALFSGAAFFGALVFFYRSVKQGDVAVSATNTGVFTVLFSYIFSYFILGERLSHANFYAVGLFVLGLVFLGLAGRAVLGYAALSGMFFSLSFVLLKFTFNYFSHVVPDHFHVFLNGIFWTRIGFVLVVLVPLLFSSIRKEVVASFRQAPPKSRIVFVLNKVLVGAGFLLLYYAIGLGDVVVINALMGFQFIFVLILTLVAQRKFPTLITPSDHLITPSKLTGIFLVVAGFLTFLIHR